MTTLSSSDLIVLDSDTEKAIQELLEYALTHDEDNFVRWAIWGTKYNYNAKTLRLIRELMNDDNPTPD